jgi:ribokinase
VRTNDAQPRSVIGAKPDAACPPEAWTPSAPRERPLVAVGDLAWDVLAKPDNLLLPGGDTTGRVQLAAGGSSANLAVWTARVGHPAGFIGKVANDRFTQYAVADLEYEGVTPHVVFTHAHPTGVILVLIDAAGQRSMLTSQGADFYLEADEIPVDAIRSAGHVHITAWSVFTDPPRQAALRAGRLGAEVGATVSFDPGSYQMIREMGRDEFRRVTRTLPVDFLLPNIDEGRALTRETKPERVHEALRDLYPGAMVVLKLDRDGVLLNDGDRLIEVAATTDNAVDATGAGDAFGGSFLGHYLRSRDARAAAELAVQVAGWVVGRFGARALPDDDLRARIQRWGYSK